MCAEPPYMFSVPRENRMHLYVHRHRHRDRHCVVIGTEGEWRYGINLSMCIEKGVSQVFIQQEREREVEIGQCRLMFAYWPIDGCCLCIN